MTRTVTARLSDAIIGFAHRFGHSPNVIYLNDVDYEALKREWGKDTAGFVAVKPNIKIVTTYMGIRVKLTELPTTIAYEQSL